MEMLNIVSILKWVLSAIVQIFLPILVVALASWASSKAIAAYKNMRETNPEMYSVVKTVAVNAVQAAEQIFGGEHGAEKKEYAKSVVEKFLSSYGLNIDLDLIDMYIESAVCELNADFIEVATIGESK
jgi:LL-H family phage holin